MPTLDDIARFQTTLSHGDVAWLHALVTDWQIIADLSFSDLVLWLPDAESKGMWAAAQIRPTTGPTTLLEDVVGTFVPAKKDPAVQEAFAAGEMREDVGTAEGRRVASSWCRWARTVGRSAWCRCAVTPQGRGRPARSRPRTASPRPSSSP